MKNFLFRRLDYHHFLNSGKACFALPFEVEAEEQVWIPGVAAVVAAVLELVCLAPDVVPPAACFAFAHAPEQQQLAVVWLAVPRVPDAEPALVDQHPEFVCSCFASLWIRVQSG